MSEPEKLDVETDVMVKGCGFSEEWRLDTYRGKTEEERDIGGVWRDNFMVGMMELLRTVN